MKALLIALCLSVLCGCANINGRILGNDPIEDHYQYTIESIAFCSFITYPQVMAPGPSEFEWINCLTIPIGACCFIIDVPLEAVCDTICYPYDSYVIRKRYEIK